MKMFVIPYLVILFKNMVIPAFVIPTNLSITKNRYNKKKSGITKKNGGITKNKTIGRLLHFLSDSDKITIFFQIPGGYQKSDNSTKYGIFRKLNVRKT